ncbi:unnamed protein product [marine sediment metagenome]|uniref:Uncharacterized protein n=1 Tax=marine sediment metagenome TaxID=412755 RepID=X0SXY2_9ZZZZ
MFDWKIIAAVFIALIVVSYVVIGVPGIREFFGSAASGIGRLLESSPFGGLFSSGSIKKTPAEITLFPDSFSLKPELPVNISAGDTLLQDFRGEIAVNLENDTISMKQEGSSLVISPRLELVVIKGLKISRLELEGMRANVKSGDVNTSIENGTLEILDFLGEGRITSDYIKLSGNVTRIRGDGWEIS